MPLGNLCCYPLSPWWDVCTFVLKGNINHFDTKLNKWVKLNEGDVQIIRSGNGISHSEEILENSEIFQIWFDPDLSKSLKRSATYNDYKHSDFKKSIANGVKIIKIHDKIKPRVILPESPKNILK